MKSPQIHRLLPLGLLALCSVFSPALHAALPVISPGERVVVSEDFANNGNTWTQVAMVNGTGAAVSGKAVINKSTWGPSSAGDGQAVASTLMLKTPITLSAEPTSLSLYLSVKVDSPEAVEINRFTVSIGEANVLPANALWLVIRPGNTGSLYYRNAAGAAEPVRTENTRNLFDVSGTYRQFKLTLRAPKGNKGELNAEAFYFEPKTGKYVSLGAIPSGAFIARSGIFDRISIESRNGASGAVWIDSVVLMQGRP